MANHLTSQYWHAIVSTIIDPLKGATFSQFSKVFHNCFFFSKSYRYYSCLGLLQILLFSKTIYFYRSVKICCGLFLTENHFEANYKYYFDLYVQVFYYVTLICFYAVISLSNVATSKVNNNLTIIKCTSVLLCSSINKRNYLSDFGFVLPYQLLLCNTSY